MSDCLWSSWGASARGPMHERSGMPNQDSWMARSYSWGNAVVVSDGLGSKPRSGFGSKAACLAVFEAAKVWWKHPSVPTEDMLRLLHAYWLVKVSPFSPSDCQATCLFAVRIDTRLILGRIGDGLVAVHGESEKGGFVMTDGKGDSFSNITDSLSREFRSDLWETVTVGIDTCKAVVLCTDGISDDLLPGKQLPFAQELFSNYKDLTPAERRNDLKRWLDQWPVPGHSDDKTVACLFKRGRTK